MTAAVPNIDVNALKAERVRRIPKKYYADPLGFVRACFPWGVKGGPLATAEGPDTNQTRFLEDLGRHVKERNFDGHTPVSPIRMAISSAHGTGKAQSKSLKIDTPSGPAVWGELQVGDCVFASDGKLTSVVARHENGVQPIYRVGFDDGSSTLVGLSHLWSVRGYPDRRRGRGFRTLTTEGILEIGITRPNGVARAKQWEIPIQGPAEFEEREIPLHPYFVGIWLGDGTKGIPQYTKPYPELADRLRSLGYTIADHAKGRSRILGIHQLFSDPVFQLGSHERYIPGDYKYNTVENRRELLRGLLDSDGECSKKQGSITYASTSRRLAEDVIWLVRSLGGKAGLQEAVKHGWYPNDVGERVECRDCWRVTIQLDWNPFTLIHRRDNWRPCEARYLKRWIESVEYSHDEDSMCITVENEDGLYLANDFIVTHNSTMGAWIATWIISTRPYSIGTVTAGTFQQLEDRTWADIMHWSKLCVTADQFDIQANGVFHKDPAKADKWKITPKTAIEARAQTFAGQHAATSTSWFLMDEASEVPESVFRTCYGGMTDGEPMMFCFGQMLRNSGEFYKLCWGDSSAWDTRVFNGWDSSLTNKITLKEWLEEYGEDDDWYRVRVLGLPPNASELQFIGKALIDGARNRDHKPLDDEPLVWGFDAANGGLAKHVFWARRGLDAASIPPIFLPGSTPRDTVVAKAADLMSDQTEGRRAAAMFGDQAFGSVILQRLRQLGFTNVFEVNFGETSHDKRQLNVRAMCWFRMREWLRLGSIPDDEKIYRGFMEPGFHNRNGRLVIESKADMAKRRAGGNLHGPDALSCTFYQTVAPVSVQKPQASSAPTGLYSWMS